MKKVLKKLVKVLLFLSVIDLAMIVGNQLGNQFPWLKASIVGIAMVVFAIGFAIGSFCEKPPKRPTPPKHTRPTTKPIEE